MKTPRLLRYFISQGGRVNGRTSGPPLLRPLRLLPNICNLYGLQLRGGDLNWRRTTQGDNAWDVWEDGSILGGFRLYIPSSWSFFLGGGERARVARRKRRQRHQWQDAREGTGWTELRGRGEMDTESYVYNMRYHEEKAMKSLNHDSKLVWPPSRPPPLLSLPGRIRPLNANGGGCCMPQSKAALLKSEGAKRRLTHTYNRQIA
jgi:hypothetical protein